VFPKFLKPPEVVPVTLWPDVCTLQPHAMLYAHAHSFATVLGALLR